MPATPLKQSPGWPLTFLLTTLTILGTSSPGASQRLVAQQPSPEPDSTAAHAEDPEPQAVFYSTATIRERALESATAAVTILDRRAIESIGVDTVAELLPFIPGLTLTTNGTRGGLTTAQIRGGDPNFTQVLIDGVPVNDSTYQVGGVFNFEALPTSAVERVEVVRGALSSVFGSTGLSGAVHIITRRGEVNSPPRVELGLASDGTWSASTSAISGGTEGTRYFLSLSRQEEEERIADERFELTHLQGRVDISLNHRVQLQLAGRWAQWQGDDYPEASGGPELGDRQLRTGDHSEAGLGLELRVRTEHGFHRMSAKVYHHELDRQSPAIVPRVPASDELTRMTRTRLGWSAGTDNLLAQMEGSGRALLGGSVGIDVDHEDGTNRSVLFLPPFLGGDVPGDYEVDRTTIGAFGELTLEHGPLVAELSLRLDSPSDHDDELSPRFSLSYRPDAGRTRFRASYGRAFKLPSFFALASPSALGGNPELRPETVTGGDLAVDHTFADGRGNVELGVFSNRYNDLVDFDFASFSHVNRSRVEAEGIELALQWKPAEHLHLATNLTHQDVKNTDTEAPLRHRPDWTAGLRLDWIVRHDLRLHLDGRYSSGFLDEQIPVPDRQLTRGYDVWGLSGSWRFADSWQLHVRAHNLFDTDYETLIGFPGAGRSLRVGVRYRVVG